MRNLALILLTILLPNGRAFRLCGTQQRLRGEVRKAGQSRYNNNSPGISANNWLSAVASAFGDEVPDQIGPAAPVYKSTPVFSNSPEGDLDLAMYAEDYGFQTPTGFTPTLRPQLRPQGIMSIQDPAVMDRVVAQVQEELPPTQEERDLYEKYSPGKHVS